MINKKHYWFIFFLCLFYSCHHEQKNISNSSPLFDIYVRYGEDAHDEYIVRTNSLSEGEINPLKDGVKVSKEIHYGLTVQDDKYYYLNEQTHFIKKYQIQDNTFATLDSLPVTQLEYLESILWISKDTLLMVGLQKDLVHPAYALVETPNMSLIAEGVIDIPNPESISWSTLGFLQRNNSKLFMSFYTKPKDDDTTSIANKIHIATFDFPQMNNLNIETITTSGRTLNDNRYQPSSIQDENGDIYFLSSGSDRLLETNDQNKGNTSSIFRIKNGASTVDSEYSINTCTDLPKGHVYGIWYIGHDKAIIKCDVPELIKSWDDYEEYAYAYYEVDLKSKALSKIDIPLDRGWYLDNVLVENGLAYIANKAQSNENYIWIYNPATKTTVKGLKVTGDFDHFRRINKIK